MKLINRILNKFGIQLVKSSKLRKYEAVAKAVKESRTHLSIVENAKKILGEAA